MHACTFLVFQSREAFVQKILKEKYAGQQTDKASVPADEMSEFYRDFLNAKWRDHLYFNLEWQRRNARVLFLSAVVAAEAVFRRK